MSLSTRQVVASICGIAGVACLTVAGFVLIDYFNTTTVGKTAPSQDVVTHTTDHPSERSVTITDEYSVPANQPRLIELVSIDERAYVQRVGVDQYKNMATPNNIHFTGWYTESVAPGEAGVSIINGHAGGRYTDGVFKHLSKLQSGDSIRVQMGDLTWRKFEVVSVDAYSVADAATKLFHNDPTIQNELHLITCDGRFDDQTQTYDERLIVVARLT